MSNVSFNDVYKAWRNRARKYNLESIVNSGLEVLCEPESDRMRELQKAPWLTMLMVKWACQDRHPRPLLGGAGDLGYDRWLKVNTAKYRTHSLFRQGLMLYDHIPNWSDERVCPLMERFSEMLMEQRVFKEIFGVI